MTRRFRMLSLDKKINIEFPSGHNTLLIMRAACQQEFQHCVPKVGKGVTSPRFNFTFRTMHAKV